LTGRTRLAARSLTSTAARHVGAFAALEDAMCDFGLDGLIPGRSADRLDALVWALTALSWE
jgi:phage terminase large subunit-like protein